MLGFLLPWQHLLLSEFKGTSDLDLLQFRVEFKEGKDNLQGAVNFMGKETILRFYALKPCIPF